MEVKSVSVLHKEPFLYLNNSSYVNNAGKLKSWTWAERPNNTHAVFIAALHRDKLVLINEFRVPVNGYVWSLPAGLIELNQTPLDTAVRELMEETGLSVKKLIRDNPVLTLTSPGMSNEGCYFVFVEAEGTPHTNLCEESEDIQVILATREQVAKILDMGENIDSKAYLIMMRFAEDGKI